jgi:hypothetical protein
MTGYVRLAGRPGYSLVLTGLIFFTALSFLSAQDRTTSFGQYVYVPVYSNISVGPRFLSIELTTIVSFRNVDPDSSVRILSMDYYDNDGILLEQYLAAPYTVPALGSFHIEIDSRDIRGGTGANMVVVWESADAIPAPIVESVMLGLSSQQGISFVGTGRVIREILP